MTLVLYAHPFSSFCQKALVAFYENQTPFEMRLLGPDDPAAAEELAKLWPLGKFPVLRDEARGVTVPEATLIIAYLDQRYSGSTRLIPIDPDAALQVNIWDRFFDNYVELPMQAVVADTFRAEGQNDPVGVAMNSEKLARAYAIIEDQLDGGWIAGDSFSLADCSAAPALVYANMVHPFAGHRKLEAYFERLLARPSFARAVEEARPYRPYFPLGWPADYL